MLEIQRYQRFSLLKPGVGHTNLCVKNLELSKFSLIKAEVGHIIHCVENTQLSKVFPGGGQNIFHVENPELSKVFPNQTWGKSEYPLC